VYGEPVVQQQSGGAAAVGDGQIEATGHDVVRVVSRERRRPMIVRVEPHFTYTVIDNACTHTRLTALFLVPER